MSDARRASTFRRLERFRRHELEREAAGLGEVQRALAQAESTRNELGQRLAERPDGPGYESLRHTGAFLRAVSAEIRLAEAEIAKQSRILEQRAEALRQRFAEVKTAELLAERAEAAQRAARDKAEAAAAEDAFRARQWQAPSKG